MSEFDAQPDRHDDASEASPPPQPARRLRAGRRPPRILWRSLTGELLRLLALTGVGLVLVISFVASIKPLADGDIGPGAVVLLMLVLSVPMLQFALPFAAGFAATLTYHRFAADREATAASAVGLSYGSLLMPAGFIAAGLAVAVALLSNTLIPRFLQTAEQLIAQDVSRLITTPLSRGRTLVINEWQITAERVNDLDPAPGSRFFDHIVLENALVARMNPPTDQAVDPAASDAEADTARTVRGPDYIAAERIDLLLANAQGADGRPSVDIFLALTNAAGQGFEGLYRLDRFTYAFEEPLRLPNAFDNNPKFLTLGELFRVRDDVRRFEQVDRWARRLAALIARQRHLDAVELRVDGGLPVRLVRGDESFSISAERAAVGPNRIALGSNPLMDTGAVGDITPVVVEQQRDDGSLIRYEARSAQLVFDDDLSLAGVLGFIRDQRDAAPARLFLKLVMQDVTTRSTPAIGPPAQQAELQIAGLIFPDAADVTEVALPLDELIAKAERQAVEGSPLADELRRELRRLRSEAAELRREIDSKLHERFAYTAASALMVLTGAVLALRLRNSLPLNVYLWSFFPALFAVITISSGQSVAQHQGPAGLLVLWGGVIALAVFTWRQWRVVTRH